LVYGGVTNTTNYTHSKDIYYLKFSNIDNNGVWIKPTYSVSNVELPENAGHTMIYDSKNNRIISYGGDFGEFNYTIVGGLATPVINRDINTFDITYNSNNNKVNLYIPDLKSVTHPPLRWLQQGIYNDNDGFLYIFGGWGGNQMASSSGSNWTNWKTIAYNDIWKLNLNNTNFSYWEQIVPAGPTMSWKYGCASTYINDLNAMVIYGGGNTNSFVLGGNPYQENQIWYLLKTE